MSTPRTSSTCEILGIPRQLCGRSIKAGRTPQRRCTIWARNWTLLVSSVVRSDSVRVCDGQLCVVLVSMTRLSSVPCACTVTYFLTRPLEMGTSQISVRCFHQSSTPIPSLVNPKMVVAQRVLALAGSPSLTGPGSDIMARERRSNGHTLATTLPPSCRAEKNIQDLTSDLPDIAALYLAVVGYDSRSAPLIQYCLHSDYGHSGYGRDGF